MINKTETRQEDIPTPDNEGLMESHRKNLEIP